MVDVAFVVVPRVAVKKPRRPEPRLKFVPKRLVDDAVVAKKLVVVAEVPVAFVKRKLPRTPVPRLKFVAKRFVDEAVVAKKLVEVAFVVVEFPTLRRVKVDDEKTMIPPFPFGVMSDPVEVAHLEFGVV